MAIKVAAFSGSLRKESFNTKLVRVFQKMAPASVEVEIVAIGGLPFINQDLENDLPQPVQDLHKSIQSADAFLMATPEYNRSFSPVLKNAIDWGSRPQGKNKWEGKPAAIIGCTPGPFGTFGAQNHLRQVLIDINMPAMPKPQFYLAKAGDKFNAQGELTDEETRKKVAEFWAAFVTWINKLK